MFLIAGPCAIESRDVVMHTADTLKEVCSRLNMSLFFKSSYDKANRTSLSSRGIGMEEGLKILQEVKTTFDLPILTDVHESWQCAPVAEVADVLQIPAFLSRQTDLLIAAAKTGKVVNVKKGQHHGICAVRLPRSKPIILSPHRLISIFGSPNVGQVLDMEISWWI